MKRINILLSTLFLISFSNPAISEDANNIVTNFINTIKEDNPKKIADLFTYPIIRWSLVPNINNKQEFLEKYDMLFDEKLKQRIINPNNWKIMKSGQAMMNNGEIWLDYDGLVISFPYFATEKEKIYTKMLIQKDKDRLPASLKNFKSNVLFFKINNGIGRIDLLPRVTEDITEEEKYQYAFWNNGKEMSDEPDIILKNGSMTIEGNPGSEHTGRNERYIFKSGTYTYSFNLNNIARNDQNYRELNIYKDDELIISYPAEIFK